MTEENVGEVHLGFTVVVTAQSDAFSGKCVANEVVATFVSDAAGAGDDFDFLVGGVDQWFVILTDAPRTGVVKLGWGLLIERLMGTLMIIRVAPAFKATLLGADVGRGRLDRFGFQVPMHAFV